MCTILLLALSGRVLATPMPDFTLPSAVDGKDISSDDFKGKVLLVTFLQLGVLRVARKFLLLFSSRKIWLLKDFPFLVFLLTREMEVMSMILSSMTRSTIPF